MELFLQYFIIFMPAFLLGILHTILPCEDKSIFFFWSFGVAKTPLRSLLILTLYGFGLMSANMIIAFISIGIGFIPLFFGIIPDSHTINFFGAISSTFAAIFLLFFITRREYLPHSKSKYKESIPLLNWEKLRTPYGFGFIAGFAPCIFELIIYSQCLQFFLSYGIFEGVFIVFYFSLGTFLGLFPLALAKHSTSQIVKTDISRHNKVLLLMIVIIIAFNTIIMILSFLRIDVFSV